MAFIPFGEDKPKLSISGKFCILTVSVEAGKANLDFIM